MEKGALLPSPTFLEYVNFLRYLDERLTRFGGKISKLQFIADPPKLFLEFNSLLTLFEDLLHKHSAVYFLRIISCSVLHLRLLPL